MAMVLSVGALKQKTKNQKQKTKNKKQKIKNQQTRTKLKGRALHWPNYLNDDICYYYLDFSPCLFYNVTLKLLKVKLSQTSLFSCR